MKSKIKNNILVVFVAFLFILPFQFFARDFYVEAEAGNTNQYYYSLLNNKNAKNFYNAIDKMEKDGILLNGNAELNLLDNNFITEKQISDYQKGNSQVLKDYGAGRDAYIFDQANNFYTDFDKLTISLGTQNGKFIASLGTGRTDNYYLENGFKTSDEIIEAKEVLEQKVKQLVGDVSTLSDLQKIEKANKILIDNVQYNFCNDEALTSFAPFIRTAYGALVNGYAVCEGYARGLKLVLDEMNIENQLVYGYLLSNNGGFEQHMWNYVKLNNKWYAIDSTINDTMSIEKYCFMQGKEDFYYEHIEEKVFSSSNYSLTYPVLSTYSFGKEKLPTKVYYTTKNDEKTLFVNLSYNNLSATELAKTGLYLSVNYSAQNSKLNDVEWMGYSAISELIKVFNTSESENNVFEETLNTTTFRDWGSMPFVKFAVI